MAATNSTGSDTTTTMTINVDPAAAAPLITNSAPTTATVGAAYGFTFTASGFPAPVFSTIDPLPVGLSLSSAGALTGTPAAGSAGSYPVTVRASNGVGSAATAGYVLMVNPAPAAPAFPAQPVPPTAVIGTPYTYTLVASGYPAPTFTLTTGSLPPGLTLDPTTGAVSGTPTGVGGTFTFTVTASNASGTSTTGSISLTVNPAAAAPVFTSAAPAGATVGTAYSHSFTASGFPAATFSTTDPLPVGLSLSSSGVLSGTASTGTSGSYSFTVVAANGVNPNASQAVSFTVTPASAAPGFGVQPVSPTAVIGTPYSYTFSATGYPAPTYTVATGSLPAGLSLDALSGILSGTPTGPAGSFPITVSASNASGTAATGTVTLTVNPADAAPVFTGTGTPPPTATIASAYSYTFTASGYPAPTFSTTDSLPVGLTLSSAGVLAGTPASGTAASYPITVTATNGIGADATRSVAVLVEPASAAPVFTGPPPGSVTVGTPYSYSFTASGFPLPNFALFSGPLPTGLSLSSAGVLSGTAAPGTEGNYPISVTASNGVGPAATRTLTLTVVPAPAAPVLTTPSAPTAEVGAPYSYTFQASGFPLPVFATSGPLPVGLTLTTAGVLTGTPASGTTGSYPITVTATNSTGSDSTTLTLVVVPASVAPVFTGTPAPPAAVVGTPYSYTFATTGYPAPLISLASGALPAGLTLNPATGELSGTPSTAGTATFEVAATNASGAAVAGPMTHTVNPAPAAPTFTSTGPPNATVGTPYSHTFTASGYPTPTFSTANPLPVGLTLSSGGLLSGTPATGTAGSYPITVTATNGVGTAAGTTFTLTVVPAPAGPMLVGASPPSGGVVGTPYPAYTFTATGYPAPTFTVAVGSLPAGLTLNTGTGTLSGTPTSAGTSTFRVRAGNFLSDDVSSDLTITITPVPAPAVLTAATPPGTAIMGAAYTYSFGASGFPQPTFAVASGSVPPGLALDASTGVLSGTPSGPVGASTFTVSATNATGTDTSGLLTVTVGPAATGGGGGGGGGGTTPAGPAPTGATLTARTSSLLASWNAVPGATGYTASVEPGSATCTTTQTSATSCLLGGTAGTGSTVTVVAHFVGGDSAASTASNEVVPAAPVVPTAAPTEVPLFLSTDAGPIGLALPGQDVVMIGRGFLPYSTVTVILYSDPIVLGSATADAFGLFRLPVTVPDDLPIGRHTLLGTGVDTDGNVRQMDLPVVVPDLTAQSTGGSPLIPLGGKIALLDPTGQAVVSLTVPEGVYSLNSRTRIIGFVPVAGFSGTATAIGYRLVDGVGTVLDGTYAAVVPPAGAAQLPLPTRIVSTVGGRGAAGVPCSLSTGQIAACTVTATVLSEGRRVKVGSGTLRTTAQQNLGQVTVKVLLTEQGRGLAARPAGVRVRFSAVVEERGRPEKTTVVRTTTVLAEQFTLSRPVRFSGASSRLSAAENAYLEKLREQLDGATELSCTGHADHRGTAANSRALGARRAKLVCDTLSEGLEVAVSSRGQAEKQLTGKNDTAANRARNNRTDITVTN